MSDPRAAAQAFLVIGIETVPGELPRVFDIGITSSDSLTVTDMKTQSYLTIAYATGPTFQEAATFMRTKLKGTFLAHHANQIAQALIAAGKIAGAPYGWTDL